MTAPIENTGLIPFHLPLTRPWFFGDLRITERRGWLVRLDTADGHTGWGETTPFQEAGTEHPRDAKAWLEQTLPQLSELSAEQALEQLPSAGDAPPAARCGLETALLDLVAKSEGVPLARFLAADAADCIAVNAALGDLVSQQPRDLRAASNAGFRCLKLKLGVAPLERELSLLEQLLEKLPARVELRLDANRAWTPEQAQRLLGRLEGAPIQLVEEPLRDPDPANLAALRAASSVPLALDESLDPASLKTWLRAEAVDFLILKPMRLGGLRPALEIARRARAAGVTPVVTTTLDGAPATYAAAHLAAAVDGKGPGVAHGLATSGWLDWDLAPPLAVQRGSITLPQASGLGCIPYPNGPRRA